MKVVKLQIALVISLLFLIAGCKEESAESAPSAFTAKIINVESQNLLNVDSIRNSINIFYLENETKKNIDYHFNVSEDSSDFSLFYSGEASFKSYFDGIKNFYIKINNQVDTLYLDVSDNKLGNGEIRKYDFKEVRWNGKLIEIQYNDESGYFWDLIVK